MSTDGYDHLREITSSSTPIDVALRSAPEDDDDLTPNVEILTFDGRDDPLGYWGEGIADTRNRAYINNIALDGDMWVEMQALLALKAPVEWDPADGSGTIVVQVQNARHNFVPQTNRRLQRISFRIVKIEDSSASS